MPLFGKSQKSPHELVKNLRDGIQALANNERDAKRLARVRHCVQFYSLLFSILQFLSASKFTICISVCAVDTRRRVEDAGADEDHAVRHG